MKASRYTLSVASFLGDLFGTYALYQHFQDDAVGFTLDHQLSQTMSFDGEQPTIWYGHQAFPEYY